MRRGSSPGPGPLPILPRARRLNDAPPHRLIHLIHLPLPLLLQSPETMPAAAPGFSPTGLLPFALVFVILYFLLIRPERKRQRKRMEMLQAVKTNDRVITTGGLHGIVAALGERTIVLKVDENVRLRFNRDAIAGVVEKEEDVEDPARAGSS